MEVTTHNYGLTETREETDSIDANVLPRAVRRPEAFLLLDGDWSFAIDLDDRGLLENWHLGHEYTDTAHWPGSIESHMTNAKDAPHPSWQDKVVAWYEREFTLPERLNGAAEHSLYQLTFGACGYETRVWLNGQPLQTIEGEPVHYGEYTSFSYELNPEFLKPVNRLTVRIADSMDAEIPRGKQESHVYKRGGIWYQTYTGAVRSVWVETVGRNRLRSRIGVFSIVEDDLLRVNLTTRIHDPGQYTIRLQVFGPIGETSDKLVAESDFPIRLEAGQKVQRLVIKVREAELWSPESPTLYRLVGQLVDASGYTTQVEAHVGLRKVEARGCCVYLNGKAMYLDGILYQPGTATFEEVKKHFAAMKELGCNLVRVHIAGVDPRIYNLADEMGLLLWVEVPSPHSSTARSRENHRAELLRMLALMETHPSIIIWSLYNEDWGAQDIATNEETRQYITELYHFMLIHHPQFLVVDNDGWHHISYEGRLKSDLLTAHLYTPNADHWRDLLDRLVRGDIEGVAAFPLVVGDPFFYRTQVPLIVSEWGGFGFVNYGGPTDSDDRADRIKLFKEELRKRPIAGDVYTQATNIEEERNGLIDFQTGELMVPAGLLKSGAR